MEGEEKKKISLQLTKEEAFVLMKAIDIYIYVDSSINYAEYNEECQSIRFQIQKNMKLKGCSNELAT